LSVIDPHQENIDLAETRTLIHQTEETIRNQPDTLAAFRLMQSTHGLTNDIICAELQMDKAQWSKVCSGSAHFPMKLLLKLMDITGSEAILQYLNYHRGYDVVPNRRKSQLEIELDEKTKQLEDERLKNKVLEGVLRGG
jgi:hypothetical protein